MASERRLRVLELFSGIGGMHYALRESQIPHEVVTAIDISSTTNKIYANNFPKTTLRQCSIKDVKVAQMDKLRIDAILMSPPCQPFTRVGKKRDDEDVRTLPFFHILQLITEMKHKPSYILVENVKGFDVSNTRQQLVETLMANEYQFQEFLLTPLQFGIPNARLRYYLLAKHQPLHFQFPLSDQPVETLPAVAQPWLVHLSPAAQTPSASTSSLPAQDSSEKCTASHTLQDCSDSCVRIACSCRPSQYATQCPRPASPCAHAQCESELCSGDDLCSTGNCDRHRQCHLHACNANSVHEKEPCTEVCSGNGSGPDAQSCSQASSLLEEDQAMEREGFILRQVETDPDSNYYQRCQIRSFLENLTEEEAQQYVLSDSDLQRFVIMDVAHPAFRKSICFTKRYSHFVEGAGSLLQMSSDVEVVRAASELKEHVVNLGRTHDWPEEDLAVVRRLKLRYFTPREIANLLCFPPEFSWPEDISTRQLYRALGNSLNVHVVAILLRLMTLGDF